MATSVTGEKQSFPGEVFNSLATFYRRRWLLWYFVQRQVTRNYRDSYLGFVWAVLGPLIWVFFITLIFSKMLGIRDRAVTGDPDLNFGLYLYCGLLPFLAWSESLSKGINCIRASSGLVQKVIFPLELLPLSQTFTSLIDKFFGVGALIVVAFIWTGQLHWTVVLLPLLVVVQMLFILGLAYLMSFIGTYVPDVGEILRPFIRGMFFFTPIIWPTGRVPESLSFLVDLNPLAYLVGAYRDLILFGELPNLMASLYFTLFAVAVFIVGFVLFVRFKPYFADQL